MALLDSTQAVIHGNVYLAVIACALWGQVLQVDTLGHFETLGFHFADDRLGVQQIANEGERMTHQERLTMLNNRLAAWWVAGEQLPEIWKEALIRFTVVMDNEAPAPFDLASDTLLTCFEDALTSYDVILENFPQERFDEEG